MIGITVFTGVMAGHRAGAGQMNPAKVLSTAILSGKPIISYPKIVTIGFFTYQGYIFYLESDKNNYEFPLKGA
mgnify:CR=1 FL=1